MKKMKLEVSPEISSQEILRLQALGYEIVFKFEACQCHDCVQFGCDMHGDSL